MHKRGAWAVSCAVLLGAWLLAAGGAQAGPEGGGVVLVSADLSGVVVRYTLPGLELEKVEIEGERFDVLRVVGSGLAVDGGKPQLPVRGLAVGIPPEAIVSVELLAVNWQDLPGRYRIAPAPAHVLQNDGLPLDAGAAPAPPAARLAWQEDAAVYGARAFYPPAVVEVVEQGAIRQQGVALVRLNLARYDPQSGRLQVVKGLTFRLAFSLPAGAGRAAWSDQPEPAGFEDLLRAHLINYEQARAWRAPALAPPAATIAQPPPGNAYRIEVRETGLYRLTYDDLYLAGLPVATLDVQTLQMFNVGTEIPLQVELGGNGAWDAADHILFYGEAFEDKYTASNVYWLTYGQAAGRRMTGRGGAPAGGAPLPACFTARRHLETNVWRSLVLDVPDIDFDRWMWLAASAPGDMDTTVDLQHLCPGGTMTVTVSLFGFTDDPDVDLDHHVELYVNGSYAGDTWWAGRTGNVATFALPLTALAAGSNELRLSSPAIAGAAIHTNMLDWYDLEYGHTYQADDDRLFFDGAGPGRWEYRVGGFTANAVDLYDVTDPLAPQRITGPVVDAAGGTWTLRFEDTRPGESRYFAQTRASRLTPAAIAADAPSSLRDPSNGADWIVISHASLMAEAQRLAGYRGARLRTMVVDLQDVYDEFSHGRANIHAIEDFLAYAYAAWQPPAPSYVVLLGDGTEDYKDYRELAPARLSYVPPYLAPVDPYMDSARQILGETAADNRYVCIAGDDTLPDMHLGRLPANSLAEARAMVDKILAYEDAPPGDWMGRVMFVADNPDKGGDFGALSEAIAGKHLPAPPYTATRVYLGDTCATASQCQASVRAGYNDGHLLVNYVGHAADQFWAGERLLQVGDMQYLNNPDRLAINLAMGCFDGVYQRPHIGYEGLAETIVRAEGRGAVASWSSTASGMALGHDYINRGFFDAVFYDGVRDLGLAAYRGKLALWTESAGRFLDLLDTFLIFGDPALRINALDVDLRLQKSVEPESGLEPGEVLTYTLTFTNAGPGVAYDVVLADILPAGLVSPTVVLSSAAVVSQQAGVTFAWDIAPLLPGDGGQVRVRAVVSPTATAGLRLTNQATITTTTPDTEPANNTAVLHRGVLLPDLYVTKTGPGVADHGQAITYTIAWGNAGTVTGSDVVLTDTLPAGVAYVGDNSPWPATFPSPGVVTWGAGEVPAGAGGTFVLTGWLPLEPPVAGPLVNRVAIGGSVLDGNPADDTAAASSRLPAALYLPIIARLSPP